MELLFYLQELWFGGLTRAGKAAVRIVRRAVRNAKRNLRTIIKKKVNKNGSGIGKIILKQDVFSETLPEPFKI